MKDCIHGLLTDLCLSSDSEWEPCSVVILSNQPEYRFTLYAQIWDWYCYYITLHWVLRNTPWCLFLSVREIKKQTTSTENVRPPQLGINVHLHSCLFLMLASPLQIFCFKTECTFHLLCLQSHGHLVSCTRFLSVWVSLSLSPLFLSGMQRWPSGPAHLWEQSAISPRPCSNSKHLASFGRFVDFCPLVFSLLLL